MEILSQPSDSLCHDADAAFAYPPAMPEIRRSILRKLQARIDSERMFYAFQKEIVRDRQSDEIKNSESVGRPAP